ncbi:MAG: hypothetical protein A3G04_03965 [Candidatus Taylorbacteria bacterium RIFCSPLOWO2_12_FULL_44_9]|nr:MAG: hypothetical protein A3G04_03965 [Candidatus Taylorbacteria bacterium RIFCSPLOWO2_12_FULL_44_9]HLD37815.1 CYTH domain-containing protein [Candidatus Nanoarchaeia archaeon]
MNIETEIKLAIKSSTINELIKKIEEVYDCKKTEPFRQITHQFFLEDYTKQNIFPRIRNEEDGRTTLTVKVKLNEKTNFFKRREMETGIDAVEQVMAMMPFLGFTKKISWEKKRQSFLMRTTDNIKLFLDETPMGWFLEIEGDEKNIEAAIAKLGLQESKRINKAYLGLWEEYKKINNIAKEDMMFSE